MAEDSEVEASLERVASTLNWSVKNVDLLDYTKPLKSPKIRAGCYIFRLEAKLTSAMIESLEIFRIDFSGDESVRVDYTISLRLVPKLLPENLLEASENASNFFRINSGWRYSNFGSLNQVELSAVTFGCDIRSVTVPRSNLQAGIRKFDYGYLSHNLGVIFESGEYSDVVLVAEGERYAAHRIILKIRWPQLYRVLEEEGQMEEYILKGVKARDLQAALRFAYTGVFDANNVNSDLLDMLDWYCTADLKHVLLNRYGQKVEAESDISTLQVKFNWTVANLSQLRPSTEVTYCVPAYCTVQKECCSSMNVTLAIIDDKNLLLKIKKLKGADIGCVRYKVNFVKGAAQKTIDDKYFSTDEEHEKRLKVEELMDYVLDDSLNMSYELELCSNNIQTKVKTWVVPNTQSQQTSDNKFFSLDRLQSDFYDFICENRQTELTDVTLRAGDDEFFVHKVFLCAMSPVFARMFDNDFLEKRQNLVAIEDVAPGTLSLIVRYIYSGCVETIDITETLSLYAAADKYELLGLKERCSEDLRKSVDAAHAGDVLLLADLHEDRNLKNSVFRFIFHNSRAVLEEKGLDVLSERYSGYPELVTSLLEKISAMK